MSTAISMETDENPTIALLRTALAEGRALTQAEDKSVTDEIHRLQMADDWSTRDVVRSMYLAVGRRAQEALDRRLMEQADKRQEKRAAWIAAKPQRWAALSPARRAVLIMLDDYKMDHHIAAILLKFVDLCEADTAQRTPPETFESNEKSW
jgi:hypothetical protein